MKRTARVLMTVLMLAVLDGGHVKPGLAQTVDDCPYQISGASGRRVCEDTALEFWDWTALETGPVTLDTQGSDHSLDVTVYTFKPYTEVVSALDEVRFTAQQGVEYTIFLQSRTQQTGTIVLSWRASSGGDDFASSTAISGSSGQSEASNVSADKESGEPDHAGDSGGASLWWTWTATATGMAAFDTRGSDFDTLLAVYTGASLNRLTEVASNDDTSQGEYQSAVRFTAQQDQTYHIAVDGYGGRTGAIVLNWRHRPCGGGDKWLVEVPDGSGLRETVFDDPAPGAPAYVLAGPNASVWYWMTDDAVTQSLYVSKDESKSVRTFYDADGLPHKVLDECSGNWMLVQRYDAKNVDFWFYDEFGTYQSGFALFEGEDDGHYYAEIDGVPVHAGKQITGVLKPSGASWTGSFTLEVDMSMIREAQPVPREIAALIDGLSSDGEERRGMVPGWRLRFAAILSPFGAWLSPRVAVAQSSIAVGDVLFWVGGTMISAAAAGLVAPAFATAGGFAVAASFLSSDTAEGIRSRLPEVPEMVRDFRHLAADNLANPDERGPVGLLQDMAEWASDKTERIRDRITSGMRKVRDIVQGTTPRELPHEAGGPAQYFPDTWEREPAWGTMEREGREPVYLEGTVTPDGDFDVANDDGEVWLKLAMTTNDDTPVKGSFEWDGVTGDVEVDPLPNDWEVPNDADATAAEQAAREAQRLAEQAEREAGQAAAELEAAEQAAREAEQAARELDGTSITDEDSRRPTPVGLQARREAHEARRLAEAERELDGTGTADTTRGETTTPQQPQSKSGSSQGNGCWTLKTSYAVTYICEGFVEYRWNDVAICLSVSGEGDTLKDAQGEITEALEYYQNKTEYIGFHPVRWGTRARISEHYTVCPPPEE